LRLTFVVRSYRRAERCLR